MFTVVYVTCPSTHNILTHMLAMLSLSLTYMAKQLLNYSVSQKHPNPQFLVLTAVTTQRFPLRFSALQPPLFFKLYWLHHFRHSATLFLLLYCLYPSTFTHYYIR